MPPMRPRIPAGALGVPDADLIEHMAARGPVRLHLLLQSHVVNATAWTISGDVTGSTHPDQVIVVGGHIDSWDPGTGAIDDGAGVAISCRCRHLIAQLPRHPARTIRVVFWGSEETGGSGAAYLDMHRNELDKIVLAGESDLGSDNVYKLELPPGAAANPGLSPLSGILAPLKIMVATTPATGCGQRCGRDSACRCAGLGTQPGRQPLFRLSPFRRRHLGDRQDAANSTRMWRHGRRRWIWWRTAI